MTDAGFSGRFVELDTLKADLPAPQIHGCAYRNRQSVRRTGKRSMLVDAASSNNKCSRISPCMVVTKEWLRLAHLTELTIVLNYDWVALSLSTCASSRQRRDSLNCR